MRRRFQVGRIKKRGKRFPKWEGRNYEPVLVAGKLKKKRRTVILGLCADFSKGDAKRKFQEILHPLNEGLHSPVQAMNSQISALAGRNKSQRITEGFT
jgi:hypothetical protein